MYREMTISDTRSVLPLYIDYYNTCEDGEWTEETAGRRIRQVLGMDGGYGLLMEDGNSPIGFVMGYFKQYDDLMSFMLEEIVIGLSSQGRGLGPWGCGDRAERCKRQYARPFLRQGRV